MNIFTRLIGLFIFFSSMSCAAAPVILFGSQDGVLNLDGSSGQQVSIAESTDLSLSNGNQVSIASWINITDTSNSVILLKTDGSTANSLSYNLRIHLNQLQFAVGDGANQAICFAPITINVWQHVVVTYNGSGTPLIYVNGVLQTCNSPQSATLSNLRATTNNAVIGYYPGAANQELNGKLDEVALWNSALSATEITSIYNSGNYVSTLVSNSNNYASAGNLQGYWRFNEGSGTSVADSSINNSVGTISGSVTWATQDFFTLSVAESSISVKDFDGYDANSHPLTWSLVGGEDQGKFSINSTTGELRFINAPDYEAPVDVAADNIYHVTIMVSANGETSTAAIVINITDIAIEVDTDGDGLLDIADLDDDNDGITDAQELIDGSDPLSEYSYKDSDGDSVPDQFEGAPYSGGDINSSDAIDSDGDGVSDYLEQFFGADQAPQWQGGNLSFSTQTALTTIGGVKSVIPVDLDKDGHMDFVAAAFIDNAVYWLKNDGAQNFTRITIATGLTDIRSVEVEDVDSDGDWDIVAGATNINQIRWYKNNGTQVFTQHTVSTNTLNVQSVTVLDVDGDGDQDILSASNTGNSVYWHENDGNEVFTDRLIDNSALGARWVFAIDLDGDADVDVLSANSGSDSIAWYRNDGSEAFTKSTISSATSNVHAIFAIDLDKDGDKDVLSANYDSDNIIWHQNNGNHVFSDVVIATGLDGARHIHPSDVDSDGDIDLIVASSLDNKVTLFKNDGSQSFSPVVLSTTAGVTYFTHAADIDGDGDIDPVSADRGSDTISWYQNNSSINGIAIELNTKAIQVTAIDPDGHTVTYTISGGADAGLFSLDPNSGVLTFNVLPNFSSPVDSNTDNVYLIEVQASANGKISTSMIEITVADNVLPIANPDSVSLIKNSAINIDIRANDSDSETANSQLTVTNLSTPSHGTLVDNGDGTVTYSHTGADFTADSFTYTINDGSEDSAPTTVNITVTEPIFQCDGTVYHSRGKSLFSVDTSTLPFTYNQIGTTPTGISSNALGFNYADGYLYAMGSTNATRGHLIKVDVLGNFTDLGLVTGLPKKNYAHGAFDINGDYYVTENYKVHVIDVNTVSRKETIRVHANHGIDIAFNPRDKKLYSANRKSVRVTDLVAKTTKLIKMTGMPESAGTFGSHWFDSQGNLYVSANKSEDVYRIASPGTTPIATYIGRGEYNGQPYDAASCVGAPSLTHTISPTNLGATGSVTHTYVIDNGLESGDTTGDPLITGLQDTLDNGRTFVGGSLVVNGAAVAPAENSYANTDTLTLSNLQVPAASKVSISIDVNIPTLSSGIYYNQAQMTNIPIGLGGDNSNLVASDYPFGFKNPDPTPFEFTGSNNQISGTVFDDYDGDGVQDSNEPGLRGVLVTIDGNNSVLSDVNGNYRFDYLNDGTHTVVSSRLNAAWVDITPETVVSNNLSGGSSQQIDFAYSQGDGVVRGTIFYDLNADGQQQENELIIQGVNLSLKDKDGNVVGSTVTSDEAGQYRFKDLIPGLYWVEVTPPNNHASVSAPLISANVVSYKDVVADFTFLSKNTISGTVFNDVDGDLNFDINELGLSGVVIELLDSNLNVYANTTTNLLGQYEFTALPAGSYTLVQTDLTGYISIGSNSINTSIPNSGAAVVNFADQETATISGIVFEDTNGNGVQDITEQGIGGVTVNLSGIGHATTDNAGLYIFSGIPNNNYTLSVGTVPNYLASPDQNVSVAAGASANANFALVLPGVIYGRLYIDSNQDLSSQESELAVANTQVLITGTGVDRYTFTDSDGYYQFESLNAQAYTVGFTVPAGYIATITTANLNLAVGASLKQSFALNYIGVVSGRVYHDVDEDQVIDADEMGLANVSITLSGQGGAVSDMQGNYLFPFISNNSYSVTEIDPSGFESVSTNVVNVTVAGDTAYANFADKFANILPIANTQNLVTNEGVAINISLTGTDNDGTIVSYQLISTPSNGTLSGSVPNVIYTPAAGFDGTDSFTFTVTDDDSGISAVATISITVNNVNILPQAAPQSLVTNEGEALNIVLSGSDSDGSIASYQVVSAPNNGVLSGAAPNLIYTPTIGFDGVDSFTFTVTDNDNGISAVATVIITVNNINLLPQADPQNLVTGVGEALNVKLSAADSDGSIVSYQVVNMPSHGKLSGAAPNLIYEPAVNFSGADSFTFVVTDNDNGTSALATVSILIVDSNQPPIANNDLISIGKNSINNLIEVLLNDSDPDNDTLSIVAASALNGVVTIGTDGKIIYSPLANSIAQDVIEYTINDGNGHQANAVVIVTIEDNNLPPIALNDQYSLESSKSIVLDVLGNDSDPEGESLTLVSVNSRMGIVEIVDNKVIFTPDTSTSGEYKFSYVIKDPAGNSAIGEVVVIIASDTGPTITLPEDLCDDLVVNANALYTRVNLGEASAIDRFGNPVPVSLLDGTQLYPPGINEAYWKATDFEGNTTVAKQLVCVIPLISIEKNQTVLEGASTNIGVFLNGESPTYPVIVPFDVEGHGEDHNLTSGQLIIEAGTSGNISVDTVVDSENERDEVVSVTLDSELNLGSKYEHLLTITEQNIAPVISLEVVQNGTKRLIVSKNDGDVQINATVYDANINDSQELMWQSITTNVVNTSLISTSYIFNPQLLDPGLYQFSLTAIDNGIPALSDLQHVYIEVVDSLEKLTGIDSDGDLIPDNIEGYEDRDGDGIPDYLDRINECNVLQEEARIFDGYLIEGQSGVCLRRGNYSSVSTLGGAQLVSNDFSAIAPVPLREDSEAINVGGIFDFIAYGLPQKGGKLGIVLPQRKPIPLNAVYRKYNADDGWFTFVEDENNSLWSTAGEPGYCPPPNLELEQSQWSPGLNEGHWCVQLVIFDGGENDDDGLTNGAIVDPGGVAVLVNGNAPPVAFDDYIEVETHSPLVIDVLTNDVDPDGDVLTITSAIANIGNVVIAEGELIYTGPQNYSGNIFINYGITDNNGGTDFAVVYIAVPINMPPIINDEMSSISQGSSITLNLLANDLDPEGETLNLIAVESDLVDFTSNGGATFTPDASFFGEVTITYQVQDIAGNKMSGRWTITVTELIELQGTTKGGGSVCWLLLLFAAMMAVRKNQLNTTRP